MDGLEAPQPKPQTMQICQRHNVSLAADLNYLNTAYMAPLHTNVLEAGAHSYRRQANPLNLGIDAMFGEVDRLRSLFAKLVGCHQPDRVAVFPAASYGLASVARNVPLTRGASVVVLQDQFPSNVYAWKRACATAGATLRTVKAPSISEAGGRAMSWNQRILEAIDHTTAAVALPNVHWSDGTLFDLAAIRTRTLEVDALLVVDGTQSVGVVPLDLKELQLDALICAGYKTLLGPYGTAFGYFGPRFDGGEPIEETWIARKNSTDFANLVDYQDAYQPHALRYEAGGRSNFITVPMMTAAIHLLLEWTPEAISAYCTDLTATVPVQLKEHGFWIEQANQRSPQLFGIRMPSGVNVNRVFEGLTQRKIAVSLRGDALRVSPHLHNTADEIQAFVEALIELAQN